MNSHGYQPPEKYFFEGKYAWCRLLIKLDALQDSRNFGFCFKGQVKEQLFFNCYSGSKCTCFLHVSMTEDNQFEPSEGKEAIKTLFPRKADVQELEKFNRQVGMGYPVCRWPSGGHNLFFYNTFTTSQAGSGLIPRPQRFIEGRQKNVLSQNTLTKV